MRCPHCDQIVFAASASDSGEPDFEPGWICPHCGEFVTDEEGEECEEERDQDQDDSGYQDLVDTYRRAKERFDNWPRP